jgi:hypothetical protein
MNTEIQYLKKKVAAMAEVQDAMHEVLSAVVMILKEAGIVDEVALKIKMNEGSE